MCCSTYRTRGILKDCFKNELTLSCWVSKCRGPGSKARPTHTVCGPCTKNRGTNSQIGGRASLQAGWFRIPCATGSLLFVLPLGAVCLAEALLQGCQGSFSLLFFEAADASTMDGHSCKRRRKAFKGGGYWFTKMQAKGGYDCFMPVQ